MANLQHNPSETPQDLTLSLLERITNNFSAGVKVGSGGFGDVYWGIYKDEKIAVKKLYDRNPGFDDEAFKKEFNNSLKLRHPNTVRLVGYCHETRQIHTEVEKGEYQFVKRIDRVLCFEYCQGGSLDKYIYEKFRERDLDTRLKIIRGISEGLNYLHNGGAEHMFHLDLKPQNILLDEKNMPKIADFGLSRFLAITKTQITSTSTGTYGYMPPEYVNGGRISSKFDVFSLGVIILEVLALPLGYSKRDDMSPREFVEQVRANWNERPPVMTSSELYRMKEYIDIALRCVEEKRDKRPKIKDIVIELEDLDAQQSVGPSRGPTIQNRPAVAKILHDLEETETRFPEERRILMNKSHFPISAKSRLVGGSAGTPCDITQKPWRLESLTISYLGLLDAFSFSYIDQAGKKQTVGPWGVAFKGYSEVKTKTINFGPSEFLIEVSGTYGSHFDNDLVMSLTFVTNISTYGPFGNPNHQNVPTSPLKFTADNGGSIVGFHGRSGSFLFAIGVYTCLSNKMTLGAPSCSKTELVGGSAGTPCDISQKPMRLESVTISYLGLLDAFSFSYIDQAGRKITVGPWGKAFKGYRDFKTKTIDFGPSEFLKEISGTYGCHFEKDLVMSLTFVTNISTYGPFGDPHHQHVPVTPFEFRADKDKSIVGFHGRSGSFLYSIGVYMV